MSNTKLTKKLVSVLSQVQKVTKSGWNSHQKYNYVTEADILEAVREALVANGIFVYTSTEVTDVQKIDGTDGKKPSLITTVKTTNVFVDSESGESMSVSSVGQGHDQLDKGVYKATTGAMKYFLMKNFLMPTGDDPENDGETAPRNESKPTSAFPGAKSAAKAETPVAAQPAEPKEEKKEPAKKPSFGSSKPAFNVPPAKVEAAGSTSVPNSEVRF